MGVVEATTNTALGGTNTIVNNSAALWMSGNLTDVTEPIDVTASGIGFGVDANGNGGALRVVGQNFNLITPTSASASAVSIGTPAANVGIALPAATDAITPARARRARRFWEKIWTIRALSGTFD
jgi:hypothetical protein